MAARRKSQDAARRVRHLIALDALNVMTRLRVRQVEMVALFSRTRDRGPLMGVVHSWFQSIAFGELSKVEPFEQAAVNQFYETLGELRWYLQYTEDMPLQVQQHVIQLMRQLELSHRRLTEAIGPPDAEGAPVVDGAVGQGEDRLASVERLAPRRQRRS